MRLLGRCDIGILYALRAGFVRALSLRPDPIFIITLSKTNIPDTLKKWSRETRPAILYNLH
jgi:hypothetical protein